MAAEQKTTCVIQDIITNISGLNPQVRLQRISDNYPPLGDHYNVPDRTNDNSILYTAKTGKLLTYNGKIPKYVRYVIYINIGYIYDESDDVDEDINDSISKAIIPPCFIRKTCYGISIDFRELEDHTYEDFYEWFPSTLSYEDCRGDKCRRDKGAGEFGQWCVACHGDPSDSGIEILECAIYDIMCFKDIPVKSILCIEKFETDIDLTTMDRLQEFISVVQSEKNILVSERQAIIDIDGRIQNYIKRMEEKKRDMEYEHQENLKRFGGTPENLDILENDIKLRISEIHQKEKDAEIALQKKEIATRMETLQREMNAEQAKLLALSDDTSDDTNDTEVSSLTKSQKKRQKRKALVEKRKNKT